MLVTRTPDRAAELLELLRERGAEPVLVPVQEAQPVTGQQLVVPGHAAFVHQHGLRGRQGRKTKAAPRSGFFYACDVGK